MSQAILRLPQVMARTGLSRSTIYLRISQGKFPKQVKLGGRAVGWLESKIDNEIDNWTSASVDKTGSDSGSIAAAAG